MKINDFFAKRLKAPLNNQQWSWGAVNPSSNSVFLRVGSWALAKYDDGKEWVTLYTPDWDVSKSHGVGERLRHIDLIAKGAPGYAVMIEFGSDGKIASFDSDQLLKLGRPVEEGGFIYAEVKDRLSIDDVVEQLKTKNSQMRDVLAIVRKYPENTEREALISCRIGQGEFRETVLGLWDYKCALTGSTTVSAIRASHIKPWKKSTAAERLDPFNGIPLLATFDALFDRGLITFDRAGGLLISSKLASAERQLLGLNDLRGIGKIPKASQPYLAYHREQVFSQ